MAVTESQTALGHLAGLGADFPNPDRLIRLFLRREAEYSSRIEQTYAGVRTLLLFDHLPDVASATPNVREVENNYQVLLHVVESAKHRRLTLSMLRELHQFLFKNSDHPPRIVGDFRKLQNWIGSQGDLTTARYIPPPPEHVLGCIDDLLQFVARPPDIPLLARTALVHYQFEAIHPFDDGNGRIGRALVLWQLVAEKALTIPLLNPSASLEARRRDYYDLMLNVTERAQWNPWVEHFCLAVKTECDRSAAVLNKLAAVRLKFQKSIHQARASALLAKLIDSLFGEPAITVKSAAKLLKLTPQSAQRAVDKLQKLKILTEITGQQRNRIYMAEEIVALFSRPNSK